MENSPDSTPGDDEIDTPPPAEDQSKNRGRSKHRKTKHSRNVSASSSDRPMSPLPPRLQNFSGDPSKGSWSSFFIKFERIADCHKWSDEKKLEGYLAV